MARRVKLPCDELRRFYIDEHQGTVALAQYYGCSPTTIARRLHECGIPVRPSRFQARVISADELRRLYEVERLPIRDIAQRLQISPSTIGNRRRTFGIPARSRTRLR